MNSKAIEEQPAQVGEQEGDGTVQMLGLQPLELPPLPDTPSGSGHPNDADIAAFRFWMEHTSEVGAAYEHAQWDLADSAMAAEAADYSD